MITRASSIEGNGCFSDVFIAAGSVVEHWDGPIVSDAALAKIEAEGKYHSSVAIGRDLNILLNVIDPAEAPTPLNEGSGVGGFNHSCDPNLWMADDRTVIARKDILPDVEMTIDYALSSTTADWQMGPCNCGSALCRRAVSGDDWRRPELQLRYKGHFAPFINEMIAGLPS